MKCQGPTQGPTTLLAAGGLYHSLAALANLALNLPQGADYDLVLASFGRSCQGRENGHSAGIEGNARLPDLFGTCIVREHEIPAAGFP